MKKMSFLILSLFIIIGCSTTPKTELNPYRDIASVNSSCIEIANTLFNASSAVKKKAFTPPVGDQTLTFSSDIQVSGNFTTFKKLNDKGDPYYYGAQGPTQLLFNGQVLPEQGVNRHWSGFSSPLGNLKGTSKALEDMSDVELRALNITVGRDVTLEYESGVVVQGRLKKIIRKNNKNIIFTFENETTEVTGPDGSFLFEKSWGIYDMVVANSIKNVDATVGRISKETFDFYQKRLFSKEVQQDVLRDLKEKGLDFILGVLKEKGFRPVKFLEYVSMEELWEKSILVHRTKGYYGIPFDVGEYGKDHGEFSHALQYYAIVKDATPEELKSFKSIFRNMETNTSAFDQMWEKFFEARGHYDQPNTPSYWRKLVDSDTP